MNMIKVLWSRFQQCLDTFTMLLVEGASETWLFRHLCDYGFRVRNFRNTQAMRVIFFSKRSKFHIDFNDVAKSLETFFCCWDHCIWIGIVKFSLWRTRYFSWTANVLTSSPKILHINKRDSFTSIYLAGVNEYDNGAVMHISTVLGHIDHVACQRVLWKKTFLTFI